jgi:radical SAM superfamily enzyme YgiQ (UPF0313 family)
MIKILLINIPGGPQPVDTPPPIAISRVIEGVDPALGCDFKFIDVDHTRPSIEELVGMVINHAPDIVGFSAILTPAYSYLKTLSLMIKDGYPKAIQVLGGQMAVLANMILQKAAVDFCVTGESEPAFSALIAKLKGTGFTRAGWASFRDIKGLAFMLDGLPFFTGYAEPPAGDIRQLNHELISKFTDVERLFPNITGDEFRRVFNGNEIGGYFSQFYPENLGKKIAHVVVTTGCVGRCTFCHRFFKGFRALDPDAVIGYIDDLLKKRDIGLIWFFGEYFGSNEASTGKIIRFLKERRLNWLVGGMRTNDAKEDVIARWKEAGCVYIAFGFESCSQKILNVMEKRTTVSENLNALNLSFKHKVLTAVVLVIGMPGETEETIDESIRNLSKALPDDISLPYEIVINYFQAVPGTPGYEYARRVGLIGSSLDDEERYIEGLYNVNANDIRHYLNFTDYRKEETAYWKNYIMLELFTAYAKKHGFLKTLKVKKANRYRYVLLYACAPRPVRRVLLKYATVLKIFGLKGLFSLLWYKLFGAKKVFFSSVHESLRKINKSAPFPVRADDVYTAVLREGR